MWIYAIKMFKSGKVSMMIDFNGFIPDGWYQSLWTVKSTDSLYLALIEDDNAVPADKVMNTLLFVERMIRNANK